MTVHSDPCGCRYSVDDGLSYLELCRGHAHWAPPPRPEKPRTPKRRKPKNPAALKKPAAWTLPVQDTLDFGGDDGV